jgi:hypothetical protein
MLLDGTLQARPGLGAGKVQSSRWSSVPRGGHARNGALSATHRGTSGVRRGWSRCVQQASGLWEYGLPPSPPWRRGARPRVPRFCDSLSYGADALESAEKATGILDSQFHSGIPTLANSPVREAEDICRRCRRSCYLTGLLSSEKLAHGWDIVRLGQTKPDAAGSRFS